MKKKPTKYLNFTIVCWVFALSALILESVAIALYLAKWSGYVSILYAISAVGFVFIGVAIAMIFCMNFTNDPSVKEERNYDIIQDKEKKEKEN